MFNENIYAASVPKMEILKIKHLGVSYKIKPLDDYELWNVNNGTVNESLCFYILGCSVLDNKSENPIGNKVSTERFDHNNKSVEFLIENILIITRERRLSDFNIYEKEKSLLLHDQFAFLKYCFCQRFKCNPNNTKPTREVLIREWVLRDMERQGTFVSERQDYLDSMQTWLLLLIAVALGYNRDDLEETVLNGNNNIKINNIHTGNATNEKINKNTELFFKALKTIYGKSNSDFDN